MDSMWKATKRVILELLQSWLRADGFGLSAALSFYAVFSLAPILVFSLLLASQFLGESDARTGAERWLEGFVSNSEAADLINLVHIDNWQGQPWWMTAVLVLMFLWAASLSFVRLRVSVNRLLGCTAKDMKQAVKNSLIGRLHAVLFTLAAGAIMTAGILLVTVGGSVVPILAQHAGVLDWIVVRLLAVTMVGGVAISIYRLLPVEPPDWRGILAGVAFVVVAFELGRLLLNAYLKHSWITSAYGAANALVVFLLWIYYTAQALLLGAALAGVLSRKPASENG